MRLINVSTRELCEFDEDGAIPPYCIASHKWRDGELTFQDVRDHSNRRKAGWQKLKDFCKTVKRIGKTQYLWLDTCCIDKTNSVELNEAINSMFRYYNRAVFCLAFLDDVSSKPDNIFTFKHSIWFKRGWTLQELVASPDVLFINREWRMFGAKQSSSYQAKRDEADRNAPELLWNPLWWLRDLSTLVSAITGIPESVLADPSTISLSHEDKWSWLEGRETKKPEDMAYCMLGIFGVFMPLIYGEGEASARARLREEIVKKEERAERERQANKMAGSTAQTGNEHIERPVLDPAARRRKIARLLQESDETRRQAYGNNPASDA